MKVLSVQQPWAGALVVALLGKDVENRDRHYSYRGELAIHASKKDAPKGTGAVIDAIVGRRGALRDAFDRCPGAFARGGIVGLVRLAGCGRRPASRWAEPGKVHLFIEDPLALFEPIPWRGQLGLFDLPDPVAQLVRDRAVRVDPNGESR